MSKELSPTICLLPVSSMSIHATGKIVRCQMSETPMGDVSDGSIIAQWDSADFKKLRQAQLNGVWTNGCKNCQMKESRNIISKRQHWKTLVIFDDLWEKVDWNKFEGNNIYHLDIAFNNLCNFKCKMCSSAYSNAWISDEKKLKEMGFQGSSGYETRTSSTFNREKWTLKSEQLIEILDRAPDLRRVEILGGEPFLVPEFTEFLKILKDRGLSKKLEIMITTNGSVITEEKLECLEGFKYVNINFSLDGTGDYFPYIRSAGIIDWNGIVEKLNLVKTWLNKPRTGIYKLNINGTFQLINMLNIKHFIEFIIKFYGWDYNIPNIYSKNRHSFEHRILVGPALFRADWATKSLIDQSLEQVHYLLDTYSFLSAIDEYRYLDNIKKLLETLRNNPPVDASDNRKKFLNYIAALDKIRSENLSIVDPELYKELIDGR